MFPTHLEKWQQKIRIGGLGTSRRRTSLILIPMIKFPLILGPNTTFKTSKLSTLRWNSNVETRYRYGNSPLHSKWLQMYEGRQSGWSTSSKLSIDLYPDFDPSLGLKTSKFHSRTLKEIAVDTGLRKKCKKEFSNYAQSGTCFDVQRLHLRATWLVKEWKLNRFLFIAIIIQLCHQDLSEDLRCYYFYHVCISLSTKSWEEAMKSTLGYTKRPLLFATYYFYQMLGAPLTFHTSMSDIWPD